MSSRHGPDLSQSEGPGLWFSEVGAAESAGSASVSPLVVGLLNWHRKKAPAVVEGVRLWQKGSGDTIVHSIFGRLVKPVQTPNYVVVCEIKFDGEVNNLQCYPP
jgi:hypothetical protein